MSFFATPVRNLTLCRVLSEGLGRTGAKLRSQTGQRGAAATPPAAHPGPGRAGPDAGRSRTEAFWKRFLGRLVCVYTDLMTRAPSTAHGHASDVTDVAGSARTRRAEWGVVPEPSSNASSLPASPELSILGCNFYRGRYRDHEIYFTDFLVNFFLTK